jgi:hypothetical protein
MSKAFIDHLLVVEAWLNQRPDILVHTQPYRELIDAPRAACKKISQLLGVSLDIDKMLGEVEPALYRNRQAKSG